MFQTIQLLKENVVLTGEDSVARVMLMAIGHLLNLMVAPGNAVLVFPLALMEENVMKRMEESAVRGYVIQMMIVK